MKSRSDLLRAWFPRLVERRERALCPTCQEGTPHGPGSRGHTTRMPWGWSVKTYEALGRPINPHSRRSQARHRRWKEGR